MNIAKRIWIIGRLVEIGRQLGELDDSPLSPQEKRKLADALRAERKKLWHQLGPEADETESCCSAGH